MSDLDVLEYDQLKECLMEYAVSAPGKERIEKLQPVYRGAAALRRRHQAVSEAARLQSSKRPIPLKGLRDIRQAARRLQTSPLDASEILELAQHLRAARRVGLYFEKRNEADAPILARLAQKLRRMPEWIQRIEQVFNDEGEMVDSASPELRSIRSKLRHARLRIQTRLDSILQNPTYHDALQERIVVIRNGRYAVPVKQNFRGAVKGAAQGQSASGATVYIEPLSVMEANNDLDNLLAEEEREIRRILAELSDRARERLDDIRLNIETLAEFDFIRAKAIFGIEYGCSEPIVADEPIVDLENARHPLLMRHFRREAAQNRRAKLDKPARQVVPTSIRLDNQTQAVVITGPNTGGKTIALKTVGLLALMCQSGVPIPADAGSRLGLFDAVCADIGDEQSIEQSLSTFSSHMTRVIRILGQATPRTLVALDEVAAGTEPTEGAALAAAVLDELMRKGAKILITTHHGSLKLYAHDKPNATNAAMTFNEKDLSPTYQLNMGAPGSSHALQIARRLGMPVEVLKAAEQSVGDGAMEMETLIQDVERLRRKMETDSAELETRLKRARARETEYKNRVDQLREQRGELKRQAEAQAQAIVKSARSVVERTVAEIRASQASKESIADARRQIQETERKLEQARRSERQKAAEAMRNLTEGTLVYIKAMKAKGVIVDPPNESGMARARVGNMTVSVSAADMELREEDQAKIMEMPKPFRRIAAEKRANASIELDLRGRRVYEAMDEADKYLDDAALAGLEQVSIIHGKGAGALRKALHEALQHNPNALRYRLGTLEEGGAGVTIVTLNE